MASEMTQPHLRLMYSPAKLMIRTHHGFICQDAINVCLLARKGITGPRHGVLSAPAGYLGFARWDTDLAALTGGLGEKWEMNGLMMKHYPSVISTQAAIDAILEQMKEHDFKAEDIARIEIDAVSRPVTNEARQAMWHPRTVPECQFSLPYTVATAAYDGDVFLESYTPQARERKNVRDLMSRISIKDDAGLPPRAARVHTTLKDGRKYAKEYLRARGHPLNPFTTPELVATIFCQPWPKGNKSGAFASVMDLYDSQAQQGFTPGTYTVKMVGTDGTVLAIAAMDVKAPPPAKK